MLRIIISCVVVISFTVCNHAAYAQKENFPQPFLPEVISQFPNVRDLTISQAEDELYFTVQSPIGELSTILCMKKVDGKWSAPEVAPFSGRYHDLEPFLSPDGLKLYYASTRPLDDSTTEPKDYDIWIVGRRDKNSKWSIPINLGPLVNSTGNEFYPAVTNSGNLYFTSDGPLSKGKDDIMVCKWNVGHHEAPVSLSDSINSEGYEFNAYVAPDESYMIYTCYNRTGGFGSGDLYISYHNGNGQWSAAKNLGEQINSEQMDYCPFVNAKTNTLYFTSKRSGIKADLTIALNMDELIKLVNRYDNGLSRIYKTQFALPKH